MTFYQNLIITSERINILHNPSINNVKIFKRIPRTIEYQVGVGRRACPARIGSTNGRVSVQWLVSDAQFSPCTVRDLLVSSNTFCAMSRLNMSWGDDAVAAADRNVLLNIYPAFLISSDGISSKSTIQR